MGSLTKNQDESLLNFLKQRLSYRQSRQLLRLAQVATLGLALFAFLLTLQMMSSSFRLAGGGVAQDLVQVTTNPFTSLFIGLLATAVVQSSSTTTALIVAIIAAGELTVSQAVPMIMGANIGTALTSTIVSLGHIGHRDEFELAVSSAGLHDFFNIITVLLLFGVEVNTHALSDSAAWLAGEIQVMQGEELGHFLFVKYCADQLLGWIRAWPYLALALALLGLFISLRLLTQAMRWLLIGRVERALNHLLFGRPWRGLLTGFGLTTIWQSSSFTTSLIVPLVATRKVGLTQSFPFIMGANVGTTTTALLAALVTSGPGRSAALAAAFTHVLFNVFGVLVLYPIPRVRQLPVWLAEQLGRLTIQSRWYGVAYVLGVFFLLPFLLIMLTEGIGWMP